MTTAYGLIPFVVIIIGDYISNVGSRRTPEEILKKYRCYVDDKVPGLSCSQGECIPLNQTCDKIPQCKHDFDEKLGCQIFSEITPCAAHKGELYERLCHNNTRCFTKDKFNASRDCQTDTWLECPGEKSSWRCRSGECIYNAQVCDKTNNCEDNSDELEGCDMKKDCGCDKLIIQSNVPKNTRGFSTGTYSKTETTSVGGINFPIYKHENDTDNIIYSNQGWKLFKYRPENPNGGNPEIRFKNCMDICPASCNNQEWTYYDKNQDDHSLDTTLTLSCHNVLDDIEPYVVEWVKALVTVIFFAAIGVLMWYKKNEMFKCLRTVRQRKQEGSISSVEENDALYGINGTNVTNVL